jgi:hypothetical protein
VLLALLRLAGAQHVHVERQLEAERQAHAEARRIIAGLIERIPRAIEAPASPEPPEAPERGPRMSNRGGPIPEDASPQTPSERPWWRRLFKG